MATRDDQRAPTSDRIRRGIDRERGGDKVDFPDPAAAPLGTDDEAAGTPPSAGARRTAADQELRAAGPRPRPAMGALWAMLLLIVVVLLAAWWGFASR